MIEQLVRRCRSYRRFREDVPVGGDTLLQLIDCARLTASGGNKQSLRYVAICDPPVNAEVFATLGWAGLLPDWPGPAPGERPPAYVVVLSDRFVARDPGIDPGIACQTMLLAAVERGLGGCIVASVDRDRLRELLGVPLGLEILLVVAIGTPAETCVVDPLDDDGDTAYWRDDADVHHVPKRALDDVVLAVVDGSRR